MGDAIPAMHIPPSSKRSFALSTLFYCVVLLAVGMGVAFIILSSPPPEPPVMGQIRGRTIRLGKFQIPRYSQDQQLQLLISGEHSLYADNRSFSVSKPSILYFSGGTEGNVRLRFDANSGSIAENSSDALLEGGVSVTCTTRHGERWVEKWQITGESLAIDAIAGTFVMHGDVWFTSGTCELDGRELNGKVNLETADLSRFSLASISRCIFMMPTKEKR